MSETTARPRRDNLPTFYGPAVVAQWCGVTRDAVSNWLRRHDDFPEPAGQLRGLERPAKLGAQFSPLPVTECPDCLFGRRVQESWVGRRLPEASTRAAASLFGSGALDTAPRLRLLAHAADRDRPVNAVVVDAIRHYLDHVAPQQESGAVPSR